MATLVLVAGSCGQQAAPDSMPSATPSATAEPARLAPAGRVFRALQVSIAERGVIEVTGTTQAGREIARRRGVVNLRTGDFRSVVQVSDGQTVRMLRRGDLTWTMAPPSYWIQLGYTRESANAARGKWVVANTSAARELVAALDPGSLVRGLLTVRPEEADRVLPVKTGDLTGNRVLVFGEGGGATVQRIYLSRGPRPRLLRVSSFRQGQRTSVDVRVVHRPFRVRLPKAEQVVQPTSSE